MKFTELVKQLHEDGFEFSVAKAGDAEVNFLTADSRKVTESTIFACVKGERADGHNFAKKAFEAGAGALVCEREIDVALPQIICRDVRRNMGKVAAALYGKPAQKLKMAAITGTTGKTTSTFMTKAILDYAGIKCGLLGTVYYYDGEKCVEAPRTTPESDIVQYMLAKMVENGCKACVMEASSHAIVQGRLEGCGFDAAGFTNLTQDHLDYHKTMESYFEAKLGLFREYMRGDWKVSVFSDNAFGRKVYEKYSDRAVSYSLEDCQADYFAKLLSISVDGMEIRLKCSEEKYQAALPLIGNHNILNALQALSIAQIMGVEIKTGIEALKNMPQVPGRLEKYNISGSGCCVIDFAHAPDGMEKLLTALRTVCQGKLISVFGAGGDRDKTKRPRMGEVASRLSDYVILTTDNPRSEDPEAIIDDIEAGVREHCTSYERITDRKQAIYKGLSMLKEGDITAIIGKGPENYMEIKGKKIPFLDKDILTGWCRQEGKEAK